MSQLALTGARIYTPFQSIEDGVILIQDARIEAVGAVSQIVIPPAYRKVPLDGLLIAPGFIDLHFHGNGKSSVMDGTVASLTELARFQAAHGVTSFLATTWAASFQQLNEIAVAFSALRNSDYKGARCLGIHLEGPFLSPHYPGGHDPKLFALPSAEEISKLQRKSGNGIKRLTMAPELPEALNVAEKLLKKGIVLSLGHSDADYKTTVAAVQAGFSGVTHCFQHFRPLLQQEVGVTGAALTIPELTAEIIADGVQLHTAVLRLLLLTKGISGLLIASDYTGQNDAESGLNQNRAEYLGPVNTRGGCATMEQAIQNFIQATQCTVSDALRLATYNPAKYSGISKRKGSLYPGKDADLVVLTPDLDVVMTMVEGEAISGLISL